MIELTALMSVYNGEKFLEESIKSVLNQSFKDFKLIIINDGSDDATKEVIDKFNDPRISVYSFENNQGVGNALNFGLSMVDTKYFVKVDADDINHPARFHKQLNFLKENPEISVVGSLVKFFPDHKTIEGTNRYQYLKSFYEMNSNKIVSSEELAEKLFWYCCITHASIMCHTDVIKTINYPEYLCGEDYYVFYNLNKKGYKFHKMNEVLVDIRVTNNSTTVRQNDYFFDILLDIKKDEIENILSHANSNIYIWGIGSLGNKVIDSNLIDVKKIKGIIDSSKDKWGTTIKGLKVYSPDVLSLRNNKIIVASTIGKFEIINNLKKMGYKHLEDFIVIW
ncbi:glycosyltransferase [Niallia circulans]|uniref:glycosyltransferase n=1 Tax=Niallia circulans TaxID=1397 RepID=UPI0035241F2C